MKKISNEPFWWGPFSGGGMIAALLVPIHIVLFWIALPLGGVELNESSLLAVVQHPLVKIYLFVFVAGCLFHWAHRFRYALFDLGVSGFRTPIAVICYGAAIVGSVWGGIVFFGA